MSELKNCPFCSGESIVVKTAKCGRYIACWDCGCRTEEFETDYAGSARDKAVAAWNRRAKPENSRQRALQTGICPMCEDCPDGCPVETPHDSRNRQENEPLTPDELRQMDGVPVYVVDAQGRGEWQFRINCGLEDDTEEWTADEDIDWDRYGDLWRAYRAKPERSEK